MERKSSDNKYFHPDFHIALDRGIRYLGEHFGDEDVKNFLTDFTKSYYSPLIKRINKDGLIHMKKHLENIYKIESAYDALKVTEGDNRLDVEIIYCPAVKYMKSVGYTPSRWFFETTDTVNSVIAGETGYNFELYDYHSETGHTKYSFWKENQQ